MSSRHPRIVIGLALAIGCCAIIVADFATAAGSRRDRTMDEVKQARTDVAQRMIDKVTVLSLTDARTLADALAGTPPKAASEELLAGVEEAQPAKFYGNRTCVVHWRLSQAQLQKNLNAVSEGLKALGETLDLTLKPVEGGFIEAEGTYRAPPARKTRDGKTIVASWPPRRLIGWGNLDVAQIAAAERRARTAAAKAVRGQVIAAKPGVTGAFAAILKDEKASAVFDAYLDGLRPAWKRYFPRGIVEVEVSLPAPSVIDKLEGISASLPEDKRPAKAVFEKARKSWGDAVYSARAAMTVTGTSAAAETPTFEFTPLSAERIPLANMTFPEKPPGQEVRKDDAKPTP